MKKSILSFFAGISLVILTAAATGVTEFKPATPKFIFMDTTWNFRSAKELIMKKAKEGFVLKSFQTNFTSGVCYIVMEKY
jgi:hypothetical protein